jgi:sigma-B regulation protein RsbU (phosphoserine phosphatase)
VEIVDIIRRSAGRMAGLIDNLTDFARGRLGGGLVLAPTLNAKLGEDLQHVLDELQSASPKRQIIRDFDIRQTFACDTPRLAQMLSNLVANAITHGDSATPVWVRAATVGDQFELSVTNLGQTISPETMQRLFQPFVRGAVRHGQQGLGLGLYIASEIAKAHEGVLTVNSDKGKICFTFRMPIPISA